MIERVKRSRPERVRPAQRHGIPPPGIYSGAKQCAYCEHWYIKPCDLNQKDACPNYVHIQKSSTKRKAK